jgi:hypothetical protein
VDEEGRTVTESQHEILRAAACEPAAPALPRLSHHHSLVQTAVAGIQTEHITTGGQLGKPTNLVGFFLFACGLNPPGFSNRRFSTTFAPPSTPRRH